MPIVTRSESRNVMATCPQESRERFQGLARRAQNGPRQRHAAIRIMCMECCCWEQAEVRNCQIFDCALWGLGGQAVEK